jgi:ribosome biogenesis GTPase
MPKDKGKSRRRIKNWRARFEAGQDVESAAAPRQKFAPREIKLGAGSFGGGQAQELAGLVQVNGLVTGVFQRGVLVRVEGRELLCGIAKTFRPPDGFEHTSPLAVGDDVTAALARDEHVGQRHLDRNHMDGMILSRQPRRTLLSRPQPRSAKRNRLYDGQSSEKVIAANIDVLLIVASTAAPPMRRGLIDRFLIIAERGELTPVLVMNKIDLADIDEQIAADFTERGVRIVRTSAVTGAGLGDLTEALSGRRSVLAGASGTGKTSLLNALLPETEAATRTVRPKDLRGRHTTSQARVYDLPCGGLLIDTPGVRELGVGITPEELPWYFPEFEPLAPQCKFRDCTHTHEPGCAVQAAVESGAIPHTRFESYLRIRETL